MIRQLCHRRDEGGLQLDPVAVREREYRPETVGQFMGKR